MQQAITSTNVDEDPCQSHCMTSHNYNELKFIDQWNGVLIIIYQETCKFMTRASGLLNSVLSMVTVFIEYHTEISMVV